MSSFTINLKLAELIDAFSLALDLAEGRQLGHARRTASIALLIGIQYGVKGYELNNIYYTAMLHDIGLYDPMESITAMDQSSIVRNHAIRGAKTAANIPYMEGISPYIKYHHERWDGKGQPEGLRGKLTPLPSRIVHLADSIEIFIQSKGFDKYSLQNFIMQEAGRKFDPSLAKIAYAIVKFDEFYETIRHPVALLQDLRPQDQITVDDQGLLDVGNSLAEVVDNKCTFTANHSIDVAKYAVLLGKHVGLKNENLHKLEVAALLHDVGKLGISNKVLYKPGKLTKEEFELITRHPYYSEMILSQVKGFDEISKWASLHHEKLDGSGYHRKCSVDDIPTEARIIAIADVFQAIISDRPYRKGLTIESVIKIMKDMANMKHLDSELLEEFLTIAPSSMNVQSARAIQNNC